MEGVDVGFRAHEALGLELAEDAQQHAPVRAGAARGRNHHVARCQLSPRVRESHFRSSLRHHGIENLKQHLTHDLTMDPVVHLSFLSFLYFIFKVSATLLLGCYMARRHFMRFDLAFPDIGTGCSRLLQFFIGALQLCIQRRNLFNLSWNLHTNFTYVAMHAASSDIRPNICYQRIPWMLQRLNLVC